MENGSGRCWAATNRPASRDWIWMRRTVWNPTPSQKRRRMGHLQYCELRKRGMAGPPGPARLVVT